MKALLTFSQPVDNNIVTIFGSVSHAATDDLSARRNISTVPKCNVHWNSDVVNGVLSIKHWTS